MSKRRSRIDPSLLTITSRGVFSVLAAMMATGVVTRAQISLPKSPSVSASPTYLIPSSVPPQAQRFLLALGDRLQKPGNERVTLTGQYSDKSGDVAAQLTWEAPGNLRFDRSGLGLAPLIYSKINGIAAAVILSTADSDVLESLLDDRPETFLYSFYNGSVTRFLGNRFRTDDGRTANYTGPWYDIFQSNGPVIAAGASVVRTKLFIFDSQTNLFDSTSYNVSQGSSAQTIITRYSDWRVQNGQAIPGQIVRTVNGAVQFTFKVTSASTGPSTADGLFDKP